MGILTHGLRLRNRRGANDPGRKPIAVNAKQAVQARDTMSPLKRPKPRFVTQRRGSSTVGEWSGARRSIPQKPTSPTRKAARRMTDCATWEAYFVAPPPRDQGPLGGIP